MKRPNKSFILTLTIVFIASLAFGFLLKLFVKITDTLRKNLLHKGYDKTLVEETIQSIKTKNKQNGIF